MQPSAFHFLDPNPAQQGLFRRCWCWKLQTSTNPCHPPHRCGGHTTRRHDQLGQLSSIIAASFAAKSSWQCPRKCHSQDPSALKVIKNKPCRTAPQTWKSQSYSEFSSIFRSIEDVYIGVHACMFQYEDIWSILRSFPCSSGCSKDAWDLQRSSCFDWWDWLGKVLSVFQSSFCRALIVSSWARWCTHWRVSCTGPVDLWDHWIWLKPLQLDITLCPTRSIQVLQSMCVILNHNLVLSWACYSLAYSRLAYSNHNNVIATSYLRSWASTGLVLSLLSDHANAGSAATGKLNFDPRWQQQNLACTQLSSHAWVFSKLTASLLELYWDPASGTFFGLPRRWRIMGCLVPDQVGALNVIAYGVVEDTRIYEIV